MILSNSLVGNHILVAKPILALSQSGGLGGVWGVCGGECGGVWMMSGEVSGVGGYRYGSGGCLGVAWGCLRGVWWFSVGEGVSGRRVVVVWCVCGSCLVGV